MRYSRQHRSINKIIKRHWSILTDDPKLREFVHEKPTITYRRAMSLRDKLVQSEYINENGRLKPRSVVGSFPCGHCSYCPLIKKDKTFVLPNGNTFTPTQFVNCHTRGVVYLMECECGAYYVGKTRQKFWKRISQHVYSMQVGKPHLPIGRHVISIHNYRAPKVTFVALCRMHIPTIGGDWKKTLLQKEQR